MKKENRRHSFAMDLLTRQHFRTYLIVLILPMIMGCIYYQRATSIVYQDAIEHSNAFLKQAASAVELRFNEISRFADSLISDADVHSFQFTQDPFKYPNTYLTIELRDQLAKLSVDNQMIKDFYVFYHDNETCCSNRYVYSYRKLYDLYHYRNYDSYESFLEHLYALGDSMGYQNLTFDLLGPSVSGISYVRPFLATSKKGGYLIILLDEKKFQEQFISMTDIDGSGIYIEDQRGNVLYQYAGEQMKIEKIDAALREKQVSAMDGVCNFSIRIDGRRMLVSAVNAGNYRYVSIVPYAEVVRRANSLLIILILVLAASVIFGMILSLEMSKRTVRPLMNIFQEISDKQPENENMDIYERLQRFYQNITSYNQEIEASLENHKPYLQYTFLNRIFHGEFSSEEEALTLAGYCGFSFGDKNYYTVLLFRISTEQLPTDAPDLSYVHACRIALREALQKILPDVPAFEPGIDQIALLYATHHNDAVRLEAEIGQIPEKLKSYVPPESFYGIAIYIGNTVGSLCEVVRSYENSRSMSHVPADLTRQIPLIRYEESQNRNMSYFYPADVEMKLINFTITGDESNLHKTLHNLLQKNIMESSLPAFLQHQFFNDMIGTLVQILTRVRMEPENWQHFYRELEALEGKDDLQKIHLICELFEQLCRLARAQNVSVTSGIIDAATAYIDTHYTSPELSLTEVADIFNVSESYLSFSFKQYKNVNFSAYLEALRMNHARELLLNMDYTTQEIAAACGYYSSNTFCRAFKRFWGYTTTQCRNGQEGQETDV